MQKILTYWTKSN